MRDVLRERTEQVGCEIALDRNGAIRQREVGLDARGRLAGRPLPQRLLRTRRALEPDQVVRAVAERPHARLSAPAQRDRLAVDLDLLAVLIDEPERPAHQERAVAIGRDQRCRTRLDAPLARDTTAQDHHHFFELTRYQLAAGLELRAALAQQRAQRPAFARPRRRPPGRSPSTPPASCRRRRCRNARAGRCRRGAGGGRRRRRSGRPPRDRPRPRPRRAPGRSPAAADRARRAGWRGSGRSARRRPPRTGRRGGPTSARR